MWDRGKGGNRKARREGSGKYVEREHYDEVLGSSEFFIYVAPNKRPKDYDALRRALEEAGVVAEYPAWSPYSPGTSYQAIKLSYRGEAIPDASLRRAHRWAHQRNFLHSFVKFR